MTIPTNWPNPERPGVPMFPERNMRHVLKKKDTGEIIIRNWKSDSYHWDMIGRSSDWCAETYFYEGPALTPAQIAEMMASERERCAKACSALGDQYAGKPARQETAYLCAANIRNLGAVP